jgi:hypothetical protein
VLKRYDRRYLLSRRLCGSDKTGRFGFARQGNSLPASAGLDKPPGLRVNDPEQRLRCRPLGLGVERARHKPNPFRFGSLTASLTGFLAVIFCPYQTTYTWSREAAGVTAIVTKSVTVEDTGSHRTQIQVLSSIHGLQSSKMIRQMDKRSRHLSVPRHRLSRERLCGALDQGETGICGRGQMDPEQGFCVSPRGWRRSIAPSGAAVPQIGDAHAGTLFTRSGR